MSKLKQFILKHWPMTLGTMMILSIVLYYVIFNGGVQVFHYDMMEQVIRFILRGYELIRTPELEWWDWTHFMGSSIFSYGFYFLFTPFWLFFAILPDKGDIPYIFMYVNMLKLVFLFGTTYLYLSKIRTSKLAVFAGASILTFSGFTMGYYNYTFFTDTLLFVPLALYFIECFLEDGRFIGFSIVIAIMAMINVYLLVLFTPYLFFYVLFRYIVIHETIEVKSMSIKALKFIAIFVLGIGVGSVLFLPSLQLMLSSSRIAELKNIFETISLRDLFRYVTSFLQPVVDRNDFNPLVSKYVVPSYGHSGGAAVFSLIITPLLLPQLLKFKNDFKHRVSLLVFYVFLAVFALFPNLYFLLQGNNDTRWMVMFIFLNAYTISYLLDDFKLIDKFNLMFSLIALGILMIGTYYYSRSNGLHITEIYYSIAKRNILILGVIAFMYALALYYLKHKQLITLLIVVLIVLEGYLSLYNIFFNPLSSISMSSEEIPSYQLTNDVVFRNIKNKDPDVYRIDVLENYGFNNPMSKDYMGFTFYSSVYNFQVDDFIQDNIASAGGWVVTANSGKWQFKEMFASKYWFDLTGGTNIPFGYTYDSTIMYGSQSVQVYKNKYPVPLLYTQTETLDYSTWRSLNGLDKMRSIMDQVILYDDSDKDAQFSSNLMKLSDFENELIYKFETIQENVVAYVVLPRSEEVKMTFKLNGEVVREFYSYEPNYSSVFVTEAFDEAVFSVTNLYGVPSEEFINSAYIEDPSDFETWYNTKSEGFVEDIKIGSNTFTGTLKSKQKQWVVSSIAYDKNWVVKVNGEKVDVVKVNGGFLGFEVGAGDLEIEGSYEPFNVYLSLLVSLISIGLLFLTKNKRWI